MLSFRTRGGQIQMRSHTGTGKNKVGYEKIRFCGTHASVIADTTSGLIRVISTDRTITLVNLQRLLTLYFNSTVIRQNAISFYQTFRDKPSIVRTGPTHFPGNRHSEQADGLHEAGPFKNFLP
jgi:hypothetical protein